MKLNIETNAAWLAERFPSTVPLSTFQVTAVSILCAALDCKVQDLTADWDKTVWADQAGAVHIPVYRPKLQTHAPASLSSLVFLAHDHGILLDLRTLRFDRVLFVMHPRPIRSPCVDHARYHPSLTQAVAEHIHGARTIWMADQDVFERDVHLTSEQRARHPAGFYADPKVWLWYRIWEMGVSHGLVQAAAKQEAVQAFDLKD